VGGKCCNFENGDRGGPERNWSERAQADQIEQLVDEPILLANIMVADPPRLPFPDHVHSLVSRNRSLRCSELAKALLGLHSSFDRSMILLQDVVQILDRSMAATAAQSSSAPRFVGFHLFIVGVLGHCSSSLGRNPAQRGIGLRIVATPLSLASISAARKSTMTKPLSYKGFNAVNACGACDTIAARHD
jgi:hypothetical protein